MKQAVAHLAPLLEKEKSQGPTKARIVLATVKGDVHDIGKNIVGVVLSCNNFDVVDLGVMVTAERILEAVEKEQTAILGLSGLITPSLDEMVHVAREMEKRGMEIPLLIGGATTSRIHTAVKIDPQYKGPVVHVLDASRSVPVSSSLIRDSTSKDFKKKIKEEYEELRQGHALRQSEKTFISIQQARENKWKVTNMDFIPAKPAFLGSKELKGYPLEEIRKYMDWTPFFQTWMLKGKYPKILEDDSVGEEATNLFKDANILLDEIIQGKKLKANAVFELFPAFSVGDDIEISPESGAQTIHFLRQQGKKAEGVPNMCLADFVATKDSGIQDYMGAFAVTVGGGLAELVRSFEEKNDDYNLIMVKALADRLAEAFTELLHEKIRKEYWGYSSEEKFFNEELLREKYAGIRPAPGYPACPDHTEKLSLFKILDAEKKTGIKLTESLAMDPAPSICGWYFAHPESKYFGLGKIAEDQVVDYSTRKKDEKEKTEKWLSPVLNYDPDL